VMVAAETCTPQNVIKKKNKPVIIILIITFFDFADLL